MGIRGKTTLLYGVGNTPDNNNYFNPLIENLDYEQGVLLVTTAIVSPQSHDFSKNQNAGDVPPLTYYLATGRRIKNPSQMLMNLSNYAELKPMLSQMQFGLTQVYPVKLKNGLPPLDGEEVELALTFTPIDEADAVRGAVWIDSGKLIPVDFLESGKYSIPSVNPELLAYLRTPKNPAYTPPPEVKAEIKAEAPSPLQTEVKTEALPKATTTEAVVILDNSHTETVSMTTDDLGKLRILRKKKVAQPPPFSTPSGPPESTESTAPNTAQVVPTSKKEVRKKRKALRKDVKATNRELKSQGVSAKNRRSTIKTMRADNKKVIRTDKQIVKAIKKGQVLPQTTATSNVTNPANTTSTNTSQNVKLSQNVSNPQVNTPQVSTSQVSTPQNPLLDNEPVEVVNVNPTTQTTQVQKLPTIPTAPQNTILPMAVQRPPVVTATMRTEATDVETTNTPETAESQIVAQSNTATNLSQNTQNKSQGKGFGQFVQDNKIALGIGLVLLLGGVVIVSMNKDNKGKGTNGLGSADKPTFKKLKLM